MIKKIRALTLLGIVAPMAAIAGSMGKPMYAPTTTVWPALYIGAFGGYGVVNGGYKQDGNSAFGRLTFGVRARPYQRAMWGAELGLQSGNEMRLQTLPSVTEATGGIPPQTTLKPLIDALITVKYSLHPTDPWFMVLKGGIAYRQLQLENATSSKDTLNAINGECQGGLGYQFNEHLSFTLLYQGIYNRNNAGVYTNNTSNIMIAHIPTEQTGFLGLEYSFF